MRASNLQVRGLPGQETVAPESFLFRGFPPEFGRDLDVDHGRNVVGNLRHVPALLCREMVRTRDNVRHSVAVAVEDLDATAVHQLARVQAARVCQTPATTTTGATATYTARSVLA